MISRHQFFFLLLIFVDFFLFLFIQNALEWSMNVRNDGLTARHLMWVLKMDLTRVVHLKWHFKREKSCFSALELVCKSWWWNFNAIDSNHVANATGIVQWTAFTLSLIDAVCIMYCKLNRLWKIEFIFYCIYDVGIRLDFITEHITNIVNVLFFTFASIYDHKNLMLSNRNW